LRGWSQRRAGTWFNGVQPAVNGPRMDSGVWERREDGGAVAGLAGRPRVVIERRWFSRCFPALRRVKKGLVILSFILRLAFFSRKACVSRWCGRVERVNPPSPELRRRAGIEPSFRFRIAL
jgi:hypothetical protein